MDPKSKQLSWKNRKARSEAFRQKRAASDAAVARLNAAKDDRWQAEIARYSAIRIAEGASPLRVAWLVRELECGLRTRDKTRTNRAFNELFAVRWTVSDGTEFKWWPVPVPFDYLEMDYIYGHADNGVSFNEAVEIQAVELHPDDFAELTWYQRIRDEEYPIVYSDNLYYRELEHPRPVQEPNVPKPTITVEQVLDYLAFLPSWEYESMRQDVADRLGFRRIVLDREYARRKAYLTGEAD